MKTKSKSKNEKVIGKLVLVGVGAAFLYQAFGPMGLIALGALLMIMS